MKVKKDISKCSKSELLTLLNNANQRLDILRNGIFNIMVTMKYVPKDEFNINSDVDFHNFNNSLKLLENKFSDLVNKLDLKIGDVIKNE